jgi:hypothetical protein
MVHTQGLEDLLSGEFMERLPAHPLDDLTQQKIARVCVIMIFTWKMIQLFLFVDDFERVISVSTVKA